MLIKSIIQKEQRRVFFRLIILFILAIISILFFLLFGAINVWHLIGKMRLTRLISLVVVAASLSVATVVFQAVVRNKILSPSVMGFEAMFSLVATATVFFLTSAVSNKIPRPIMFLIQTFLMTFLSVFLFTSLIGKRKNSIHLLVLVGIVTGVFLRSLTQMMISIMDPNEFLNVLDTKTASFMLIDKASLLITSIVSIITGIFIFKKRHSLEVISLGEDIATNLGLDYNKEIKILLSLSSILVACATALAGPLMFFGLLIANISSLYLRSNKMKYYLVASIFFGICVLIGGQSILEHLLNQATVLPVVIEFLGGILLLIMIVKEAHI